ncbi:MAG TPA: ABC transporter permease [Puia sp.]|jgi:putative ABC transport system permease protein|nr:ABC transporter permease [Puia sp.]
MLKNYFKTAWRNLIKNKSHSLINITGLSVGMAVTILIGLWIWDEITFDHYHKNHATIAQVWDTQTWNGETGTGRGIDIPLASELQNKYSDNFKHIVLSSTIEDGHILAANDKQIIRSGMWTQPEFPDMFSFKMLEGNKAALQDPSSILISESLSKTLFGSNDPVNKIVRLDNKSELKVSGVFEDLPGNSTFHDAAFFLPWNKYLESQDKDAQTKWGNHANWLFVQMNDNIAFDRTTAKIKNIPKEHLKDGNEEILLHPMDKWHLYSDFNNGKVAGGRIEFVWMFGIIGAFVLLLACINFMNLSTARSEKRAKEVGIRKAIGSLRSQLINQFFSESLLTAIIAFLVALLLVVLSIPFFNNVSGKQISLPWNDIYFWIIGIGFSIITGLIAGVYPALYLSSFRPIKVLKGTFKAGRNASIPRKVLVTVQFTVSIALIIGTIVIFRQIQFAKQRPVGYSKAGLISVAINTSELSGHYNTLRNDLLKTGAVENMSESSSPTTSVGAALSGFEWQGKNPNSNPLFGAIGVTHDYGKTIDWQITQGRDFSRDFSTDSGAIILNESAVKLIGFKNPVGKTISYNGIDHKITGVVKDMLMESPYSSVSPTLFIMDYNWANFITVKIKPEMDAHNALAKIEPVFKKYNPVSPFEYKFIDTEFAKKFEAEQNIGNLASFFAALAIFISCLGLFGMASFMAEQRVKEIGVRKVLGASVFNLWGLLSKDFVVMALISFLIATPIAYYFMHNWLQNYQYRTNLSWWIFAFAGIGALLITLFTVSFQAIKAAIANPVKSLRTE